MPKQKCQTSGCKRWGQGDPPLCAECWQEGFYDDAEEDSTTETIIDKILAHPTVQNIVDRGVDAVAKKFDDMGNQMVGRVDNIVQAIMMKQMQQQQEQSAPKPKPLEPRVVLGFAPELTLTRDMIKERKRALAALFHPDKDGNTEGLQRINEAAETLLKEIGE